MTDRRDFLAAMLGGAGISHTEIPEEASPEIRAAFLGGRPIVLEMTQRGGSKTTIDFAIRLRPAREDEDFTDWEVRSVYGDEG